MKCIPEKKKFKGGHQKCIAEDVTISYTQSDHWNFIQNPLFDNSCEAVANALLCIFLD